MLLSWVATHASDMGGRPLLTAHTMSNVGKTAGGQDGVLSVCNVAIRLLRYGHPLKWID